MKMAENVAKIIDREVDSKGTLLTDIRIEREEILYSSEHRV